MCHRVSPRLTSYWPVVAHTGPRVPATATTAASVITTSVCVGIPMIGAALATTGHPVSGDMATPESPISGGPSNSRSVVATGTGSGSGAELTIGAGSAGTDTVGCGCGARSGSAAAMSGCATGAGVAGNGSAAASGTAPVTGDGALIIASELLICGTLTGGARPAKR